MQIKRAIWFICGILLLMVAYIGLVLPGIPWSTPTVGAAYCFAQSSPRLHRWLHTHPLFGPFLLGWQKKRIFPTRAKYFMVVTMCSSLLMMWFATVNWIAVVCIAGIMMLVCICTWRFPGSDAEWQRRADAGEKSFWMK
jgi:uncharacterized protein